MICVTLPWKLSVPVCKIEITSDSPLASVSKKSKRWKMLESQRFRFSLLHLPKQTDLPYTRTCIHTHICTHILAHTHIHMHMHSWWVWKAKLFFFFFFFWSLRLIQTCGHGGDDTQGTQPVCSAGVQTPVTRKGRCCGVRVWVLSLCAECD
jgi:hypothetical protein